MNENKKCCDSNEEKHCEGKHEKNCKRTELESQIETLSTELELAKKTIEEQKSTITSYLSTASYYKNELDNQKKDFDRYKERNKNFESEIAVKANESIAKKLLPILDNFDQAIAHVDAEVMKGFAMIYGSLINVLTDLGIVEINTENEKLNPELHNCISTEETADEEQDDMIASVYQKGYMFAESKKVVRPATVSVYKLNG
jgi:molecular chaperone GrpE